MSVEIADYRPEYAETVVGLRTRAFTALPVAPDTTGEVYIPDERRLVALDGTDIVGHLGIWPMAQHFAGRRVPMGGVAGVVVDPRYRNQGVSRRLLAAAVPRMRELGDAISTLYPATVPPYRRSGWELAGVRMLRHLPTRVLRQLPAPESPAGLRPAQFPDDLDALVALHDAVTCSEAGGLGTNPLWAQRSLEPDPDEGDELLVAELDGELVGYLHYERTADAEAPYAYKLKAHQLVASARDAKLALLRFLGSWSSMAESVRYVSAPADPLLLELDEIDMRMEPFPAHWMTRLVDASAAFAARAYPPAAEVTVPLAIEDPLAPWNDGPFVVEVANGKAALTPGGAGRVRVDIATLAPLFTGFLSANVLGRLGRLPGAATDEVAALADAFDGPLPYLRDFF